MYIGDTNLVFSRWSIFLLDRTDRTRCETDNYKWRKFIEAQIPEAHLPKSEFHCTVIYNPEEMAERN